ncbi:hypothetical protein WJX81_001224 [Elliptochloris bilobata]|uniref:Tetrapyrrole methylase domain-containing protein n=1 Tax=Elliptochloris bilobata TaxID=381761 RepID=A0AAW1S1B3_9CHLO
MQMNDQGATGVRSPWPLPSGLATVSSASGTAARAGCILAVDVFQDLCCLCTAVTAVTTAHPFSFRERLRDWCQQQRVFEGLAHAAKALAAVAESCEERQAPIRCHSTFWRSATQLLGAFCGESEGRELAWPLDAGLITAYLQNGLPALARIAVVLAAKRRALPAGAEAPLRESLRDPTHKEWYYQAGTSAPTLAALILDLPAIGCSFAGCGNLGSCLSEMHLRTKACSSCNIARGRLLASVILAEDTRHTSKLLKHFGVRTPLISFHGHNEYSKADQVLERLRAGAAVALVSDAGMPAVSDPGAGLVAAAAAAGLRVTPVPGPSAVLSALVASGLPTAEFHFAGFLPPKAHARRQRLAQLAGVEATLLLFVPPHALAAVLADAAQALGAGRRCVVARELTKVHEEFFRSTLGEAATEFASRTPKGEVTLVVEGALQSLLAAATDADIEAALRSLLERGVSSSQAAREVRTPLQAVHTLAAQFGVPYQRVHNMAVKIGQLGVDVMKFRSFHDSGALN